LEGGNDRADVGLSVLIQHPDVDQIGLRCNAIESVVAARITGGRAIAGDNSRDMSAMPARVIAVAIIAGGNKCAAAEEIDCARTAREANSTAAGSNCRRTALDGGRVVDAGDDAGGRPQ